MIYVCPRVTLKTNLNQKLPREFGPNGRGYQNNKSIENAIFLTVVNARSSAPGGNVRYSWKNGALPEGHVLESLKIFRALPPIVACFERENGFNHIFIYRASFCRNEKEKKESKRRGRSFKCKCGTCDVTWNQRHSLHYVQITLSWRSSFPIGFSAPTPLNCCATRCRVTNFCWRPCMATRSRLNANNVFLG